MVDGLLLRILLLGFVLKNALSSDNSFLVSRDFASCVSSSSSHREPVPVTAFSFPNNISFTSLLNSTAQNFRYLAASLPKPILIFTPSAESHVQSAVLCARKHDLHLRIRSGGHDYEGVSYVSQIQQPFIIIDFSQLRSVTVDLDRKTAWAQAGATIGELYYRVSERTRTYGIPAGLYTSLGVGGHITGGGYGFLMRKYGLAADNVIDARIVDADGRVLDRMSMGEDLFWATRGGAGGSFAVILAWEIQLVPVPSTVTAFAVSRTLEQGATRILYKWQQVADKVDENLFIGLRITPANGSRGGQRTVSATFDAVFLGGAGELLRVMASSFPELRLSLNDCREMSWIEAVVFNAGFPGGTDPAILLQGRSLFRNYFKAKSDFVQKPIPESALEGLWKLFVEDDSPVMLWNPFGGMMNNISESAIPFPHRSGNIFMIQYVSAWNDPGQATEERHIQWIRKLYSYMTPYVSSSPRRSYANYRDFDLGMNARGNTSFSVAAASWGRSYFNNNILRLAKVKTVVDPTNFLRHEQSIPLLPS